MPSISDPNEKRLERGNNSSVGDVMYAVSLVAVLLALFGTLVHRDMASRAKASKQLEAWREHEAMIASQIAATASVIEQERSRLEPILELLPGFPKDCHSGETIGAPKPRWKYEFVMTSPDRILVNVTASAAIVDGVLTPITVTSADGVEDSRIIALLSEAYLERGWEYNVGTSTH